MSWGKNISNNRETADTILTIGKKTRFLVNRVAINMVREINMAINEKMNVILLSSIPPEPNDRKLTTM